MITILKLVFVARVCIILRRVRAVDGCVTDVLLSLIWYTKPAIIALATAVIIALTVALANSKILLLLQYSISP